jgi:polysaccharide deacetylase family protein (PEP-CTERM system associated)
MIHKKVMKNKNMERLNMISVDLEDWHHSCYLKDFVTESNYIQRISSSTEQILNVFKKHKVIATFFTLGCIAEENPKLIKRIYDEGHEIASHGYTHTPLWDHNPETFRNEITKTNQIIEGITGEKVIGFRAPYASLNKETAWAIKILEEEGFVYDSSVFPMKTPLYGVNNAPLNPYKINSDNILENNPNAKIIEIPFSIYKLSFLKIPCTGAIYGRFLPLWLLKVLLNKIEKHRPINFYFHPWEIDKEIPRINAPLKNKFLSYYHTNNYLDKIDEVIKSFNFCSIKHYISANEKSI